MRPSFLFRSFAILVCWLASTGLASASHVMGTELSYEYVGTAANPNRYHVTVRLFRDLVSAVDQPTIDLVCGQNECGNTLPGSFTYMMMRTSTTPVATGCATPNLRYSLDVFDALLTLAPAHWTLSINVANRQRGVVNIALSDQFTSFIKAELDNTNGLTNSSPRFTTARIIQLAGSQPQRYSASAFDTEGDSLVYQLVQPLAEPTTAAPCGFATTGAIAPHFQINAATGELLTVAGPAQQGLYAMAVRVSEFRRINGTWQSIGSIMRDANYIVSTGTNQPPAFTRVTRTGSPGTQLLGQTIRVNPGQTLSLTLTATDADAGQVLALSSGVVSVIPGATFQDLGGGQGLLTWQVPATLPVGRYGLTATAIDNACPAVGADMVTLPVLVTQQVLATHTRQALAQPPFPVPFSEVVRFRFAGQGSQPVTITDALGRKVAQLETAADGSVVWQPTTALPNGLYFARNADGTQVARLQYSNN
jgi:hypothetical protein